jgi:hypothetical protein
MIRAGCGAEARGSLASQVVKLKRAAGVVLQVPTGDPAAAAACGEQ